MIKLTEKSRRILRVIYRGVGVTAAALTLSSCPPPWFNFEAPEYGMAMYGPGPDIIREEILIRGFVKYNEAGIKNIAVYIKEINYQANTYSNSGEFYIYVPKRESYTIIFTDIDAEENGGCFKQRIITLTKEEAEALRENPLIIELEKETDEE